MARNKVERERRRLAQYCERERERARERAREREREREREAPSGRIADGYMKAAAPQLARINETAGSVQPTAKLSSRPNQASDFVIAARGRKSEFSASRSPFPTASR